MRRTRYAIDTAERGEVHVLAHYDHQVPSIVARAGLTPTSEPWTPGRRTIAGEPRWTVDNAAIRAACRALGVEWDVRVTRTKSQRTNGVHRLRVRNGRPVHYITGPALADIAEATATLWHELTHAAQAERVAREAGVHHDATAANRVWCAFVRRQQRYPYSVRPVEVEARKTAELPPLPIPLVKPA